MPSATSAIVVRAPSRGTALHPLLGAEEREELVSARFARRIVRLFEEADEVARDARVDVRVDRAQPRLELARRDRVVRVLLAFEPAVARLDLLGVAHDAHRRRAAR